MRPGKIRRLRNIIAGRSYLRDRAIQMGEQFGAWQAEWALSNFKRSEAVDKFVMYWIRMQWYARRIWHENLDYQS